MLHSKSIRINHRIRAAKIRLIGSDGKQIGVVSVDEGLKQAQSENLDLVEISPTANPPVCRILEFGKYLYTLEKQEKEARKKQHVISVKEIKMTPNIEDHDYHTKLRSALTFLERGDKVKLTVTFRGREVARPEFGEKVMQRFAQDISDIAELEKDEGMERRSKIKLFKPKMQPKKTLKVAATAQSGSAEKSTNAKTEDQQSSTQAI